MLGATQYLAASRVTGSHIILHLNLIGFTNMTYSDFFRFKFTRIVARFDNLRASSNILMEAFAS